MLRGILLLASRLRECRNPRDDASDHKEKRYDGPNDTPALGRAPVSLCKDAGVGAVYFAEDEIVTLLHISDKNQTEWIRIRSYNVPNAVKSGHNTNEKLNSL